MHKGDTRRGEAKEAGRQKKQSLGTCTLIIIQRMGIEPTTSAVLKPRHNQLDHLCAAATHGCCDVFSIICAHQKIFDVPPIWISNLLHSPSHEHVSITRKINHSLGIRGLFFSPFIHDAPSPRYPHIALVAHIQLTLDGVMPVIASLLLDLDYCCISTLSQHIIAIVNGLLGLPCDLHSHGSL